MMYHLFYIAQYVWRYSQRGGLQYNYPVKFREMFTHLPESVNKIDAAYERPNDNSLIFVSGKFEIHQCTEYNLNSFNIIFHISYLSFIKLTM